MLVDAILILIDAQRIVVGCAVESYWFECIKVDLELEENAWDLVGVFGADQESWKIDW